MAPAKEALPEAGEVATPVKGVANPWLANRLMRPTPIDKLNTTNYLCDENNVPMATVEQVYWTESSGGCPQPIRATRAIDGSYELGGGFMRKIAGKEPYVPRPLKYIGVREMALIIEADDAEIVRAAIRNKILEAEQLASDDGKFRIPVVAVRDYISTRISPSMRQYMLERLEWVVTGNIDKLEEQSE